MAVEHLKPIKTVLGLSETAFFRFFVPLAALAPFVGEYAHFFFLFITLIDIGRCWWYFADKQRQREDARIVFRFGSLYFHKKTLNKIFYGLKMIANIAASLALILGTVLLAEHLGNAALAPTPLGLDLAHWLSLGQELFLWGVVAPTAVRYFLKIFINEHKTTDVQKQPPEKAVKNLMYGVTMTGVTIGLWFLFFDPTRTVEGGLMLGALLLIVSNMIPILNDGIRLSARALSRWPEWVTVTMLDRLSFEGQRRMQHKQNHLPKIDPNQPSALPYISASALLITGFAMILNNPDKTYFLSPDMERFEPSAGVTLVLMGFVLATAYEAYRCRNEFKQSAKLLWSRGEIETVRYNKIEAGTK